MNDYDLDTFAANLEDLYEIGTSQIPAIADQFSEAASALGGSAKGVEGNGDIQTYTPFQSYGQSEQPDDYYSLDGGSALMDGTLSSFVAWQKVAEEFGKCLGNTDENLRLAAGALLLAVREFSEEDDLNAKLIEGEEPHFKQSELDELSGVGGDKPEDFKDLVEL